jgi:DNA-binding NtrC family response regulator
LSDVNLNAEMSGLDLAHSVRHAFPSLPVILISGYCDQDTIEMDGFPFISKPFVIEAILKAVDGAIRPRVFRAACSAP